MLLVAIKLASLLALFVSSGGTSFRHPSPWIEIPVKSFAVLFGLFALRETLTFFGFSETTWLVVATGIFIAVFLTLSKLPPVTAPFRRHAPVIAIVAIAILIIPPNWFSTQMQDENPIAPPSVDVRAASSEAPVPFPPIVRTQPGATVAETHGGPGIVYFPKAVDGTHVTSALKAAGLEFSTRPSVHAGIFPTNSIVCASDASPEVLRKIISAFVDNGLPIVQIAQFENEHEEDFQVLARVDVDTGFARQYLYPPLTVGQLASVDGCPTMLSNYPLS